MLWLDRAVFVSFKLAQSLKLAQNGTMHACDCQRINLHSEASRSCHALLTKLVAGILKQQKVILKWQMRHKLTRKNGFYETGYSL